MAQLSRLVTVVLLACCPYGTAGRTGAPSWHPHQALASKPKGFPLEVTKMTDLGQNQFQAEVGASSGCEIKKLLANNRKNGQPLKIRLEGECEEESTAAETARAPTAAKSAPTEVEAPAAAAGSSAGKLEWWGNCATCGTCQASIPVEEKFTKKGWVLPAIPAASKACEACAGCTATLARLPPSERLKGQRRQIKVFLGASGAAVMLAETTSGPAVVKLWCGMQAPYHQAEYHKHPVPTECKDEHLEPLVYNKKKDKACPEKGGLFNYGKCNFAFLDSLQMLYDAANLTAITPRTWSGPLIATLPPSLKAAAKPNSVFEDEGKGGQRVSTSAQFYEVAAGVSTEALNSGSVSDESVKVLKKINSAQVRMAAVADLLFAESDRHGQNVFVTAGGDIQIIDNEGAFGPTNSMFLPGTQKHEIYRIGYGAVCCGNLPKGSCPGKPSQKSPEHVYDYRCHTPGGAMGYDYPPGVMRFLEEMAPLNAWEMKKKFAMTRIEHAERLKERTAWMHTLGFEGALNKVLAGQPAGDGVKYGNNFSYPIVPACCDVDDKACDFRDSRRFPAGSF